MTNVVLDYRVEGQFSTADAYKQKILAKYYRQKVTRRELLLSRKECEEQFPGPKEFAHLNCHTMFSILSGVDDPDSLFEGAKNSGIETIAVTELGYMSSIPDCWSAAQANKIKFIPGICAYFNDFDVKRREIEANDPFKLKEHPQLLAACSKNRTPTITLVAKNEAGYKDLLNLNVESWEKGYYYTPRVNRAMLEKYAGNIMVFSGTLLDEFIRVGYIRSVENYQYGAVSAFEYIKWFQDKFGDDFYVEIMMKCIDSNWGSDLDRLSTLFPLLKNVESESGKRPNILITNDVRHVNRDDWKLLRAMNAVSRNTTLNRVREYSTELYIKTRAELRATFQTCLYDRVMSLNEFELGCDNAVKVGSMCQGFKADVSPKLPDIKDADQLLKKKVAVELVKRGWNKDTTKYEVDGKLVTYVEQASIELNRFIEKGFSSYFLIMQDLIGRSHQLNMDVGPARGSAGGSLVCYLLGITSMNPILFGLSFDRFLSASRGGNMLKVSMD